MNRTKIIHQNGANRFISCVLISTIISLISLIVPLGMASAPAVPTQSGPPGLSEMSPEDIHKCLLDTKNCAGTIANQLHKLESTYLEKAIIQIRTERGGKKLEIDLSDLTEKASFDPATGLLNNGLASVNLFTIPEKYSVKTLPDGRIKINGASIDGKLSTGTDGLLMVVGAIDGVSPSAGTLFSLSEEDDEGRSIIEFKPGGKIDRIDPAKEAIITNLIPEKLKAGEKPPGIFLPGGHVLNSGSLITRAGGLYAPDIELNPDASNPTVDHIDIAAQKGDLPIIFDTRERNKPRYAYIGKDVAEVKGEGARMTLRDGNTIVPNKDYGADKQGRENILPIDYISIFSEGGKARIYNPRKGSEIETDIIGKAGTENGFWRFSSDGEKVRETPLSNLWESRSYDAVAANVKFYKSDGSKQTFYEIKVEDKPKGVVDDYLNPLFKSWRNQPAEDAGEVRRRTVIAMQQLVGLKGDLDDGNVDATSKTNPDYEKYPGTQAVCNDAGCMAAYLAGSPYRKDMDDRGLVQNIYDLRRNKKIVPYLESLGLYHEFGEDEISGLGFSAQIPEKYFSEQITKESMGYTPKPGDVLFLDTYSTYNKESKTWEKLKTLYHSVVVGTVKNGKIDMVYGMAPYNPNNPAGPASSGLYYFKWDDYMAQRRAGSLNKDGSIKYYPRMYIPRGVGTLPGLRETGEFKAEKAE